jgi:hypothetical protein
MVNELEGKEQHRVEVSNRFAAWEDLDIEGEIIRENTQISAE